MTDGVLSADELQRLHELFAAEAQELATRIEAGALALEQNPVDEELLHEVFRNTHSLKGAAATCGLESVARLAHVLETMLDAWRAHALSPEREHYSALLEAADLLSQMAAAPAAEPSDGFEALLTRLDRLGRVHGSTPHADAEPALKAACALRVRFALAPDAFQCGGDPLLVMREVESLCDRLDVELDASALPALSALLSDEAALAWNLTLVPSAQTSRAQLVDAFSFFEASSTVVWADEVDTVESAPLPSGDQAPSPAARPADAAPQAAQPQSSLRVPTERVDKIIDLVGELVIAHSAVRELARTATGPSAVALQQAVLLSERHLRELQERVLAVRMVPIGTLFARVPRVVRDLSERLHKDVQLVLAGEDTELDKSLSEKLVDPLLHLVRNALDHGVELPSERSASGKPARATLKASAYARGGNVFVEVSDDGRGLDRDRILHVARQRGVVAADAQLSEEQIFKLLTAPGFSTKEEVSDISGRGVGLDVVQRNIAALGGELMIASTLGAGTTFTLRLPLTLTIVDGLLVQAGDQACVIPLTEVAFALRIADSQVRSIAGLGDALALDDETIPIAQLTRVLHRPALHHDGPQVAVVVHAGPYRYALRVDGLVGQVQSVVKSLESNYRRVAGIMGATILGDGRVALIVDGQGLGAALGFERRTKHAGVPAKETRSWSERN